MKHFEDKNHLYLVQPYNFFTYKSPRNFTIVHCLGYFADTIVAISRQLQQVVPEVDYFAHDIYLLDTTNTLAVYINTLPKAWTDQGAQKIEKWLKILELQPSYIYNGR